MWGGVGVCGCVSEREYTAGVHACVCVYMYTGADAALSVCLLVLCVCVHILEHMLVSGYACIQVEIELSLCTYETRG